MFCLSAAWAQGPSEILWLDAEHTRPYVIPQDVLSRLDWSVPEKANLSALGLSEEQATALRARIARKAQEQTAGKAAGAECVPYPVGDGFGLADPPPGTQTLADLVGAVDVSLTGRVVRLTPAWNPVSARPHTLVTLRTDELLKDGKRGLAAGQELSYLLPYGTVNFGKVRECLILPEGIYTPRVGDRVLFLGWRDPVNPQNLYVKSFFEVRDGKVMPGAHASLKDRKPVPLANLKSNLQGKED
jgi:hypothetical protein